MPERITVSVYSPEDRGYPIAVRRAGPVPALHSTILYLSLIHI